MYLDKVTFILICPGVFGFFLLPSISLLIEYGTEIGYPLAPSAISGVGSSFAFFLSAIIVIIIKDYINQFIK